MTIDELIPLLERALRGEMLSSDLSNLWPDFPDDPYLAEVRGDLEFALEHLPVHATDRNRPNLDLWRDSVEYNDLEIHLANLREMRQHEQGA